MAALTPNTKFYITVTSLPIIETAQKSLPAIEIVLDTTIGIEKYIKKAVEKLQND